MRNSIIATITIILVVGAAPSQAASRTSGQEAVGVGSGALIGVLAGGPLGLIVGAAAGAKIGDAMHRKNARIKTLRASVVDSGNALAQLENDIDTLGAEIERLQNVARPELLRLLQAGITMDLLFRTDEAVLVDTTGDRLAQLAGALAAMPDIHIELDGFADERGDADYNQALSERRVQSIRDRFVAAGVDPNRIKLRAHGESVAADATLDSYALERRVSIRLFIDASPSLAANPNPSSL